MERTLNPKGIWQRLRGDHRYARISTAYYWDWMLYIDDDYLTEWEILRMKELYLWQLQELSTQAVFFFGLGWLLTFPTMGPIVRSSVHGWMLRAPIAVVFAMFMSVQAANWQRPCKYFHEVMAQPAPHGSYLRKTIKEHFPVWWNQVSKQLHENGHSLPEMNEYDKQTLIPRTHTAFDTSLY